ncbi:tape measure protein [Desulfovibrio sp. OttesenSCG-928-A18]|nr:tape measure protein [Desulfovibrio sp. OttesenSCG-928-A18]
MAYRISTIQAAVVADTRQFDLSLREAQKTAEAFYQRSAKSFGRLEKDLLAMKSATGMTEKEFAKLHAAMKDGTALSAASRFLDKVARSASLTDAEFRKLERSMGLAGKSGLANRFKNDAQAAQSYQSALAGLKTAITGYLSINMLRDVAKTSVDLASMQKTFYALTGSTEGARAEIAYLRDESQRLGLDFFALTESFKGFSAAGKTASMDAAQVRDIFTSVTEASTVLGLNADRTKLALYALEQMLSKGAVSMEELRRQLGDQLPGAFQLGAKAMDLTTQEFSKLVETGRLASADFLPRFAEELRKAYGPGLAEAMKTPRAEIQRLMNELTFAKVQIGEGGFLAGLSSGAKELAESLRSAEVKQSLRSLGEGLGAVTGILAKGVAVAVENADAIKMLGVAYLGYKGFAIASEAATARLVATGAIASRSEITRSAAIGVTIKSFREKALAVKNSITATNAAITADLNAAKASHQSTLAVQQEALARASLAKYIAANSVGSKEQAFAFNLLAKAEREYIGLTGAASRATAQLTAAQARATVAARSMAGAQSLLLAAGRGVLSFFGGPWGLALTAATVGVFALSTAETDADKVAREYGVTLDEIAERYKALALEAQATTGETNHLTESHRKAIAEQRALKQQEIDILKERLAARRELLAFFDDTDVSDMDATLLGSSGFAEIEFLSSAVTEFYKEYKEVVKLFDEQSISAKEAELRLGNLRMKLEELAKADGGFSYHSQEARNLGDEINETLTIFVALMKKMGEAESTTPFASHIKAFQEYNKKGAELLGKWADESDSGKRQKLDDDLKLMKDYVERQRATLEGNDDALAQLAKKAAQAEEVYQKKLKSLSRGSSGASGRTAGSIERTIDSLTAKVEGLRGKLHEDAGETYLSRLNKDIADAERGIAKLSGAQKVQAQELLKEYRALGELMAAKENEKQFQKNMQVRLDFEREYADMTGLTADAVSRSLQRQYEDYRKAGVDIVQLEEWKADKIMRASRTAADGMARAFKDYALDAMDAAKNMEDLVGSTFSGMEDALVNFVTRGKLSFTELANSIIADLARIAIRQGITGPLASGLSSALGGLFGGMASSFTGGSYSGPLSTGGYSTPNLSGYVVPSAKGNTFYAGSGLSRYTNSIVDKPTLFAFAKGGIPGVGMMGEKAGSPGEAVMPLVRDSRGDLAVSAVGMTGNSTVRAPVQVSIQVHNNSSAEVTAQASQDAFGNISIDMIVDQVESRMAGKAMRGMSPYARAIDKTRGTSDAMRSLRRV